MARERRSGLDRVDVGATAQQLARRLARSGAYLDHPGALAEPASLFKCREDLVRVARPAGGVACWVFSNVARTRSRRHRARGIERPLDLGRSLEHERHELAPPRGTETGARPAEADARDEVPARSRIGAERDTRPSSSSSTISAQPRRLTRRSSAASPETVVTVRAVSRAGWASSNHASSSLWLSSARTSFPADEACSGTSAPTQPTTPRRCAASSWVTISIAVRPVTMARSADSPARSRSRRSGLSAASISAPWGSALRASRNSSLPITHPAGSLGDEPAVGERPERAADGRSRLPGRARERRRRGRRGGLGDRGEDVDRPVERNGSRDAARGFRYCSSDEQSRQSDEQVSSSTDADRL